MIKAAIGWLFSFDMYKVITSWILFILLTAMICRDVWVSNQIDHLRNRMDEVSEKLGAVSPYPIYGDMQFPKVNTAASRADLFVLVGVDRKIAIDAVKKRDDEITRLKAELESRPRK